MSGDVQPRKRKDKKRKKEDQLGPRAEPEDEIIHVQDEHETGGGFVAKIIFFSVLSCLLAVTGMVLVENRGLTDFETNLRQSKFGYLFEGWVDESIQMHEDDNQHSIADSGEDHGSEEHESEEHGSEEHGSEEHGSEEHDQSLELDHSDDHSEQDDENHTDEVNSHEIEDKENADIDQDSEDDDKGDSVEPVAEVGESGEEQDLEDYTTEKSASSAEDDDDAYEGNDYGSIETSKEVELHGDASIEANNYDDEEETMNSEESKEEENASAGPVEDKDAEPVVPSLEGSEENEIIPEDSAEYLAEVDAIEEEEVVDNTAGEEELLKRQEVEKAAVEEDNGSKVKALPDNGAEDSDDEWPMEIKRSGAQSADSKLNDEIGRAEAHLLNVEDV